ncbi:MAG: hypothetical protein M0Z86_00540 [Deltaproteobacteria bacterium]|jgi:hypothetical protein|nr:hypothetical protein [Deltaproteobacteria bacterium]
MVITLKSVQTKSVKKRGLYYIKARKALESIKGSLGKDMILFFDASALVKFIP